MSVTETQIQGSNLDEKSSEEKVVTRSAAKVTFVISNEGNEHSVDKNVTQLKTEDENSDDITFYF